MSGIGGVDVRSKEEALMSGLHRGNVDDGNTQKGLISGILRGR
jgi:hypothetical protein